MGEASLEDLAPAMKVDLWNLRGAFVGNGSYKVRDSLLSLGLVESRSVRGLELFRLTPLGRVVAAWWRVERSRPVAVEASLGFDGRRGARRGAHST